MGCKYHQVSYKASALGIEFVRACAEPEQHLTTLTRRQKRIAVLVACGKSDAEIASEMALSRKQVRNQLTAIMNKTGCENRTRLALWALHEGLITVQEAWEGESVTTPPGSTAIAAACIVPPSAAAHRAYPEGTRHEGQRWPKAVTA